MRIIWSHRITVLDAHGHRHVIAGPGNGATSRALRAVGRMYGAIKVPGNILRWSADGH
jgi:hypothetical protein